jgi:hypothetical protein
MTDQDRFVSLVGKASDSSEVQAWLKELKAAPPRLKKGDTTANVVLPKAGMELVFTDEAFMTGRDDLAIGEGALLLTAVFLKSSRVADFADYAGTLPGGIVFGEAPDQVHKRMGLPETVHASLPKEFWTRDGLQIGVTYDREKTGVKQVTLVMPKPTGRRA